MHTNKISEERGRRTCRFALVHPPLLPYRWVNPAMSALILKFCTAFALIFATIRLSQMQDSRLP